jgi:hypothetical protein
MTVASPWTTPVSGKRSKHLRLAADAARQAEVIMSEHGVPLSAALRGERVVGRGDPQIALMTGDSQPGLSSVKPGRDLAGCRVGRAIEYHQDLERGVVLGQPAADGMAR